MFKSAAFILLITATSLFSFAHPSPHPRPRKTIATIPLPERSGLTRSDGVFDYAKAVHSIAATKNKHRQNMINIERNKGRDASAFLAGTGVKPIATPSFTPDFARALSARRKGSEPLTDQNQDTEWTGVVSIGTPHQSFVIDFDTGSSDLWIPSTECQTSVCNLKHRYDPSKSSSSRRQPGSFTIEYGDGTSVNGSVFTDTVVVAGIKADGQFLAGASNISGMFAGDPTEGILGMAFPALSRFGHDPFFQTALQQHSVEASSFCFYLAKTNSELHLGGPDNSLFSGSIESHRLSSHHGFWQIGNAHITVNGNEAAANFETVLDSGTTIMFGPPDQVDSVYNNVPGSKVFDPSIGLYEFPCDSIPSVSFGWGGREWVVTADNFNLGTTSHGSSTCVGALAAVDLQLGDGVWLLGDSFMKNVYTVFDVDDREVGFAQLLA